MDRSKWFFHPLTIFVVSILALGTSLILYIYWYIEVSAGLKSVIRKFNLDSSQVLTAQTWVVILVLSILVGLILLGLFTIFVYSQKMVQLYRLQHNFITILPMSLKRRWHRYDFTWKPSNGMNWVAMINLSISITCCRMSHACRTIYRAF
jgi:hypothetical protein